MKGKKFWIYRDMTDYQVYLKEPQFQEGGKDTSREILEWDTEPEEFPYFEMCVGEFEALTGLVLENGQFCEMRLNTVGKIWETEIID